jgi:SAM-dependent methyltransferase
MLCGPGSWCLDFCKKYPDAQIQCADTDPHIVNLALENVSHVRSSKVKIDQIKRLPPYPFPANKFDAIHLQSGTSILNLSEWHIVIRDMWRMLKPGGWLNLVDFEPGPLAQPAADRTLTILGKILKALDRSVDSQGIMPYNACTFGPQSLTEGGFTDVNYHLYPVNLGGWNNPMGRAFLTSVVLRPEMLLDLGVRTGVSTSEELQLLLREMQREVRQIGFCGIGMLVSTFGRKPLNLDN